MVSLIHNIAGHVHWTFHNLDTLVLAGCVCPGSPAAGSPQTKDPAGGHPTSDLAIEAEQPGVAQPEQQAEVSFCGLHLGDGKSATEQPRTPAVAQAMQPWEARGSPQGSVYWSASETGSRLVSGKTILAVTQRNISRARSTVEEVAPSQCMQVT